MMRKAAVIAVTLLISLAAASSFAANRFWVGDGGTWSDTAHWSATSGGAGGQTVPTTSDNCSIDANSITTGSQTIDASGGFSCLDMDWTGALHTPAFTMGPNHIAGNLTLIAGMTIGPTGGSSVAWSLEGTSKTVITAGQQVGFDITGSYTLGDNYASHAGTTNASNTIQSETGATFDTGGFSAQVNNLGDQATPGGGTYKLNNSVVTIEDNIRGGIIDAGTSTIIMSPQVDFSEVASSNAVLNAMEFQHSGLATSDVQVGNTFSAATWTLDPNVIVSTKGDNTVTVSGAMNCTSTAGNDIVTGGPVQQVGNPTPGIMTVANATGSQIVCDYIDLHRTSCSGDALPCVAGAHGVDNGENTNWCFGDQAACPTFTPTPIVNHCCQCTDGTGVGHPGNTCLDDTWIGENIPPPNNSIEAVGGCAALCVLVGGTSTADVEPGNCAPFGLDGNCVASTPTPTPTVTPTVAVPAGCCACNGPSCVAVGDGETCPTDDGCVRVDSGSCFGSVCSVGSPTPTPTATPDVCCCPCCNRGCR